MISTIFFLIGGAIVLSAIKDKKSKTHEDEICELMDMCDEAKFKEERNE